MGNMNDETLFSMMKEVLYTPVVGDILDTHGYFHQFLPQGIRPLSPEMKVAGRAMPVLLMTVFGHQSEPFGLLTQALDDLHENEVYVAAGAQYTCAAWGELLTAAAKTRRAAGAVVDGFHRDTPQVLSQGFPTFSRGAWAQDSAPRMKVVDFRVRIEMEGIAIESGDLIFGDYDGVIVIPRAIEADIVAEALEKAKSEKTVRKEIEAGMSATNAFKQYGVL